jgi:ribA/ribD-fused uncharacterized protein
MNRPLIFPVVRSCLFSNTSPHGFRLEGVRWHNVQHYLLAQRFAGTPVADAIRSAATFEEARQLFHSSDPPRLGNWRQTERDLMEKAALAKFQSHPRLRAALLATGNRPLIQEPPFFRSGSALISDNRLGCALMQVRGTLRRSAAQKAAWAARRAADKQAKAEGKQGASNQEANIQDIDRHETVA